ncbi:MAG: DUF4388 domain-containing protein [Acidobacteria bacterium]|nr:DUF4388 domain-containing protein [Acidobacteriota bacterium]
MALEGTLKDFSLADIFQLIGLQRKTGVLTLRGKDDTVTVTFLDGKVVAADSLNKRLENRLGHVLVKSNTLTQEQLSQALEIQKETLQRLGFILTHYKIISQEALRAALQLQILGIVYRLFRWKDGDYHFSQETTIEYDRDNVVPITAESILMEGARMIDEWPIIEKRIRSQEMIFRKKEIAQEIVVVSADDADEVAFDGDASRLKKKKKTDSNKIRISEEENAVYRAINGRLTVGDLVEIGKMSEFDTSKCLYELLTRDLIEEVRHQATSATTTIEEVVVDRTVTDEIPPLPLPLVIVLGVVAIVSLLFTFQNPLALNSMAPFMRRASPLTELKKAISLRRIEAVSDGVYAHYLANGKMPRTLKELAPMFVGTNVLTDPWGNEYRYLPKPTENPDRYLVIGFAPDGKPDTDLFLARPVQAVSSASSPSQQTGGIELID